METLCHHCDSVGRNELDSFLDSAFLMRDISTLAQLTGSLHRNGWGWDAARQNCPTVLVQETGAQKDFVALSNFKICPLFSQLYLIQKHLRDCGYLQIIGATLFAERFFFFSSNVTVCCRYHFLLIFLPLS